MPTGREIWETGQEPDYTIDDIARVEGVNRALAERIWASLHGLAQADG